MPLLNFSRGSLSLENARSHKLVIIQNTEALIPMAAVTERT